MGHIERTWDGKFEDGVSELAATDLATVAIARGSAGSRHGVLGDIVTTIAVSIPLQSSVLVTFGGGLVNTQPNCHEETFTQPLQRTVVDFGVAVRASWLLEAANICDFRR
jgi:hypothetical protein